MDFDGFKMFQPSKSIKIHQNSMKTHCFTVSIFFKDFKPSKISAAPGAPAEALSPSHQGQNGHSAMGQAGHGAEPGYGAMLRRWKI